MCMISTDKRKAAKPPTFVECWRRSPFWPSVVIGFFLHPTVSMIERGISPNSLMYIVPSCILAILFFPWYLRASRRVMAERTPKHCRSCGYCRTGLASEARCPECGFTPTDAAREQEDRASAKGTQPDPLIDPLWAFEGDTFVRKAVLMAGLCFIGWELSLLLIYLYKIIIP